ncbi:MAG: hypothetical protein ACRDOI_41275 [Trebonia sp.]
MEAGRLGVGEFAFPGALRDQLVAAILNGAKTTTTGLLDDYKRDDEPLPRPGDRSSAPRHWISPRCCARPGPRRTANKRMPR